MLRILSYCTRRVYLDVEERGPRDIRYRRPHLLPRMDDVHSERVNGVPPDIVPVHAGDQDLTLVVIHEQAPDHDALACWNKIKIYFKGFKTKAVTQF